MDFYEIIVEQSKKEGFNIFASYNTSKPKDLMIRGKAFYAVWNPETGLWSTDDNLVIKMVDKSLFEKYQEIREQYPEAKIKVQYLKDSHTGGLKNFRSYVINQSDDYRLLDNDLTFLNTEVGLEDYVSKRLPYILQEGNYDAYDELIGTLYDPPERRKLEWAIGAVVAGEAKYIEKFIVIYGDPGSGKGTVLKIIQKLFQGYYTMFDAKAITSHNNTFATEIFKTNPLVAIQEDGDLSRVEDNTKLNSIVSHEEMLMNEKFKSSYVSKVNCFPFIGTNSHIKITESKSGIIRRLINVNPSGRLVPNARFNMLNKQIDYELGAIAYRCLQVYRNLGKNFYDGYRPRDMILRTNHFYNFINDNTEEFIIEGGISLMRAYTMYKEFCEDSKIDKPMQKFRFRDEFKNYFDHFYEITRPASEGGRQVRNWYAGFKVDKFQETGLVVYLDESPEELPAWLVFTESQSKIDGMLADMPAQYSNAEGTPFEPWDKVNRTLSQLDTSKEHFVLMPLDHIVIDFDLRDGDGNKDKLLNLQAASLWKPTYAEYSRSGEGLHLHYIYDGDPTTLSANYAPGIEIKVFKGKSSLRRKLSACNNLEVEHLVSGLPISKGDKKMLNQAFVQTEKSIRTAINKNLKKEIHSSTKSSVDFIYKILEDAYESGLEYDVSDLLPKVMAFANNSTNQSENCIKLVSKMKFKSEPREPPSLENTSDLPIVFYDVEVFPNLVVLCYKPQGQDKSKVKLFNPTPQQIEELMAFKLIGFNNRRYDNHIIYAIYLGYNNYQVYEVSKKIIDKDNSFNGFREAHNISYSDVYDFCYKKQSLKKWEIELGIHHEELGLDWDEPVPVELWEKVADYCGVDVDATEKTFDANSGDWTARQILAKLSGLTVNDTTNAHTIKIILGGDRDAKKQFVYTDLSEMFPGYTFDKGVSTYRGEVVGEGGYVYANPGVYGNVALLDVQSMHPASAIAMDMFGPYTKTFRELRDTRIAIKQGDYETAKTYFNGRLAPYLTNKDDAKALSNALKLAINSVYGLTSARFDSAFKDPRNKDNICAKRGALFMIDLKHAVEERGFVVAHIKTDSIKIPDATPEIIEFVKDFGERYGYVFEHEQTYDRLCLINKAVYACRFKNRNGDWEWSSTGTQFIHPYVFKTIFSKEPIELKDMIETRSVKTAMYLDFNERLPEDDHSYKFVGKEGAFYPVLPGTGGGLLIKKVGDKFDSVTGTKGFRWLEAEVLNGIGSMDIIDVQYYRDLIDDAKKEISKYCDYEWFVSDIPYDKVNNGIYPFY